ncbi:MAG: beta-ketoacyl synthase N-terminal-like domain-containing protein [Bryobacteraceae bacterium]
MPETRVVATAAGAIASIGAGADAIVEALWAGRGGSVESSMLAGRRVAEIVDFTPVPWLGSKGIRVLDRAARLLCVAAQMALDAAKVEAPPDGDPELGLVCGTMFGGVHSIATFDHTAVTEGPSAVNPAHFPNTVINSPTGHAGIKFRLRGINSTISAGFASGLQAIGYGADFVRFGRARGVLAGGLEELSEEAILGFEKSGMLSASGTARPFGTQRDGAVPGEGAALLYLETPESAAARGATPRFEIRGFGAAHEATGLHGRSSGAARAIAQAIEAAAIAPADIACVFASANGEKLGDEIEARALREIFGDSCPPVCAPKAAWGEAMGAGAALAAVAATSALEKQAVPPTHCFQETERGLPLSREPQPISGNYALVNAVGCDGIDTSLVIGLWSK